MKKQNGFGLIILLISIAIIAFILAGTYYGVSTDKNIAINESMSGAIKKRSILENQLNAIKKAEEAKDALEERDRNMLDI
jgi:Tfp pilus assembly major pilin PilA